MRRALLVAVLAGLAVGTLMAGLPHAENSLCDNDPGGRTEGTSYSSSIGLWPLGTTCDFASGAARWKVEHRTGVAEGLGWVALASVLFAAALVTRSAAARGAADASVLLATVALGWHFAEAPGALLFALTPGTVLVFVVDRALRPVPRPLLAPAAVAVALPPTALFAWACGHVFDLPYLGAAAGLLAGAAAAALVARLSRGFASPAVAR
jgi:hypothetical protein